MSVPNCLEAETILPLTVLAFNIFRLWQLFYKNVTVHKALFAVRGALKKNQ